MRIVLDLNIIISALLKKSTNRKIILDNRFEFYFPETAFHKILKYRSYILEKTKMRDGEFLILLIRLFSRVTLISRRRLLEYREQARKIMSLIDDEDSIFIASALSLGEEAIIWSDDRHFDRQNRVKVWKTEEVIRQPNNLN